ncbi:MAG: amidohydrolase family protein, partial [Planctomycetales bacterium]|nr:amidohydrolase family protein [Planctomycetales bacterium]
CKLSGMVTEADWSGWKNSDFTPYLDIVLEAFGAGRVMIGSDWPVCMLAGAYSEVMPIVEDYIAQLTAAEQEGVLGGNCARFYGIPQAP